MNKGKIIVAGIGPGSEADITPAVLAAIQSSDVIIGYKYYFRFITHLLREGTECIDTGMKREQARAEQAFAYANEGKTVCVISSGDAGIYGMTPLIYEMKKESGSEIEIESYPGISAFQKAASLLGAPIGHDFCVISLSGGANDLSKELANLLGAEAIITTQSDNANLWALDTLGKKYDWTLIAKDSNVAISTFVNGKPTALLLDIRDKGTDYLERTVPSHVSIFYFFEAIPQQDYELLIIVSPQQYDTSIPTITYIPKVLHLGMGCRKDMQGDPTIVYEYIKDVLCDKRL